MKKALSLMLICICIFGLVACGNDGVRIVSIEQTGRSALCVIEYFFEDADNRYYFPYPDSACIIVTYSNGDSEGIVPALKAGRATISDLDRFDIKYGIEPKK